MTENATPATPTRRTIVKGAAWAAPVIAVAVATPAAAASTTNPADEFHFFLTAGEVIGTAESTGSYRSNGVRLSPNDSTNPKIVPAGTVFTITIEYTGSLADFDFANVPFPYNDVATMKTYNPGWDIDVTKTKLVYTYTTTAATSEPTAPSQQWALEPTLRPEDDSITFSGTAVIPAGEDFPEGATIVNLIVDPNGGTGALTGPTQTSWPTA